MSRIDDLINGFCPNGVTVFYMWEVTSWDKKFNEVENFKQELVTKYRYLLAGDLKTLSVDAGGNVRLLSTGNDDQGWTTEEMAADFLAEGEVVAIPWGGRASVQYYKGKFVTTDNRIAKVKDKGTLETKFLYYFMLQNLDLLSSFYRGSGIQHPSMSKVLEMRIPVPPIEVQREIVSILDKFTELEAELEAELIARRKQYEHYRNQLLTFDSISRNRFTLESICTLITSGGTPPTNKQDEYYGGDIPWVRTTDVSNSGIFDTPIKITADGLKNSSAKMIPPQSLIIAMIGATVGKVAYTEIEVSTNQNCCNLVIDPQIANYKYIYHWLLNSTQMLISLAPGAVPILNASAIRQISVDLPDVPTQTQIANQLDQFSDLIISLDSGLPAEITARRKQNGYYRDKLLAFKELEVA